MPNEKTQISNKMLILICSGLVSIIIATTGWLSSTTYAKLAQIEKEVVMCRLKLTELEAKMISQERVKDIVFRQILEYHSIK